MTYLDIWLTVLSVLLVGLCAAAVTVALLYPRHPVPAPAGVGGGVRGATPETVLAAAPVVDGQSLRDWLIHHHPLHGDAWSRVVCDFYSRAAAEPQIKRYFAGIDMEKLQRHFLSALVVLTHTGLTERAATTLGGRHKYLGITPADYDMVGQVLVDTLCDHGVPQGAVTDLMPALKILRERIVHVARP